MAKNIYELTDEELEQLSVEELEDMLMELDNVTQTRATNENEAKNRVNYVDKRIENAETEIEELKSAGVKLETNTEREIRLNNEIEEARRAEIAKERIKRNLLRRARRKENEENRERNIEKRKIENELRIAEEEKRKKDEAEKRKSLISEIKAQRELVKEQEENILQFHQEEQERKQKFAHYDELIRNGKESLTIEELEKMRIDDLEIYKYCMEHSILESGIRIYFKKKYHDFSEAVSPEDEDMPRIMDILRQKYPNSYNSYFLETMDMYNFMYGYGDDEDGFDR